jgi:hypothetical protein
MKPKSNDDTVPKALRDVWGWKEAVYRATEGMTTSEALKWIHNDASAVRKAFGLHVSEPRTIKACVAEERSPYGRKPDS